MIGGHNKEAKSLISVLTTNVKKIMVVSIKGMIIISMLIWITNGIITFVIA